LDLWYEGFDSLFFIEYVFYSFDFSV